MNKSNWRQSRKLILNTNQKSISYLFSKGFLATDELNKIKKIKQEKRDYLIYKTGNKKGLKHDFQKFKIVRSFKTEIYSGITMLNDVLEEQINLRDEINTFKVSKKPRNPDKRLKKNNFWKHN